MTEPILSANNDKKTQVLFQDMWERSRLFLNVLVVACLQFQYFVDQANP